MYRELLEGIEVQDKFISLKLFQWLCFTKRPLTLNEIFEALTIDHTSSFIDLQDFYRELWTTGSPEDRGTRLIVLSCGLAEFTKKGEQDVVQFIHQSVPEFLIEDDGLRILNGSKRAQSSERGEAHYQISRSCIKYFNLFDDAGLSRHVELHSELDRFGRHEITKSTFLDYASRHWNEHARDAELSDESLSSADLLDFFTWPSVSFLIHSNI